MLSKDSDTKVDADIIKYIMEARVQGMLPN